MADEEKKLKEIWTKFHGGALSEKFNRNVVSVFHPRGVMRQNVLVFDTMERLKVAGLFDSATAVDGTAKILHTPVDVFHKSPYAFASGHNVNFAFAREEILEQLEGLAGQTVKMPKEHTDKVKALLEYIGRHGSSQQIRRAFHL